MLLEEAVKSQFLFCPRSLNQKLTLMSFSLTFDLQWRKKRQRRLKKKRRRMRAKAN